MEQYKLIITEDTWRDAENIFTYIATALEAPEAALKQYDRITKAIESLATFPARIKIIDNEPAHSKEVRKLLVDNFSVLFTIKGDTVTILRILYSASDLSNKLQDE